jgi:L-fucose isomerase-like protein
MRASEKLLQKYGITVVPVDMSEIIAAANKIDENDPAVTEKVNAIQEYGSCSVFHKGKIAKQARFGLAVENWINENNIDISALQCWESIEKNYGCAACVTMSMMGEKLMPSACEVDIADNFDVCPGFGSPNAVGHSRLERQFCRRPQQGGVHPLFELSEIVLPKRY